MNIITKLKCDHSLWHYLEQKKSRIDRSVNFVSSAQICNSYCVPHENTVTALSTDEATAHSSSTDAEGDQLDIDHYL